MAHNPSASTALRSSRTKRVKLSAGDQTAPLERALQILAASCDGAAAKDGMGFNRMDTAFGHKLANTPFAEWTPAQHRAAWRMLAKYRQQLLSNGVDYDSIPEPPQLLIEEVQKRIMLSADEQSFVITFPYDLALVNEVRQIPRRRFNGITKTWSAPTTPPTVRAVWEFGAAHDFVFSDEALIACHAGVEITALNIAASQATVTELHLDGLGGDLYPFQRAGVVYATQAKRLFLADEMGLGKTVQALATLLALDAFPAVIVCPSSLKLNWKREANFWLPGRRVEVVEGRVNGTRHAPVHGLGPADIIVVNYDIVTSWLSALQSVNPKAVIFDESHYLKGHKAQRTKAAEHLVEGVDVRLMLTGTPFLNRPSEGISPLKILGRLDDLGGFWFYADRYCAAYRDGSRWNLDRNANLDELNERLRAVCYVRRTKQQVLTELPPKVRSMVPVELTPRARQEYDRASRAVVEYLAEQAEQEAAFVRSLTGLSKKEQQAARRERREITAHKARQAETLVRLNTLRRLLAKGKLEAIHEWVETFVESGEKLVLFAWHREIVKTLAKTFKAPHIDGTTPVNARQTAVDRFQKDPDCRLLVLNMQAGGLGLTLTAASNVAFCELPWTPAMLDQAEDRCHRIGQTSSVNAWYLLCQETIEADIYKLIAQKRAVVNAATDGQANKPSLHLVKTIVARMLSQTTPTDSTNPPTR